MLRTLSALALVASLLILPAAACAGNPKCVDVETATAKQLQAGLKGAGAKVSKAIIAFRKAQRTAATKAGKKTWTFKNWKTLMKVKGLGPKFCADNVSKVCFAGKIQKTCPKK